MEEGNERSLISSCSCSGSVKYVHPFCLNDWLLFKSSRSKKWKKCEICGEKYSLPLLTGVLKFLSIL
jgi:E3 ubiquitin-protein ligase DOA10